ncbi:MAG: hypothetical protein RL150_525 [Candidatus Parcubacteria bacterium]|jgi:sugar-specific transcriptional regulator TrmB
MQKAHIESLLEGLGLSKNEVAVYLAMLTLGPTTVIAIAQLTGIRRTTVYPTIDSLQQKGLAREVIAGFKKKYEAESPRKLENMLEYKRKELKDQIPELLALYNVQGDTSSVITYHEGLASIKSVYLDMLEELAPESFYYVVSDIDTLFSLDRPFFNHYKEKLAKLPITARVLSKPGPLFADFLTYQQNYNHEAKALPESAALQVDIMITPHKLVMVQLTEPVSALVIKNKSAIQAQETMFTLLWNSLV